jgi:hypothetical protein
VVARQLLLLHPVVVLVLVVVVHLLLSRCRITLKNVIRYFLVFFYFYTEKDADSRNIIYRTVRVYNTPTWGPRHLQPSIQVSESITGRMQTASVSIVATTSSTARVYNTPT